MNKKIFEDLEAQYSFRKYQKLILNQVENILAKDNKFHIIVSS